MKNQYLAWRFGFGNSRCGITIKIHWSIGYFGRWKACNADITVNCWCIMRITWFSWMLWCNTWELLFDSQLCGTSCISFDDWNRCCNCCLCSTWATSSMLYRSSENWIRQYFSLLFGRIYDLILWNDFALRSQLNQPFGGNIEWCLRFLIRTALAWFLPRRCPVSAAFMLFSLFDKPAAEHLSVAQTEMKKVYKIEFLVVWGEYFWKKKKAILGNKLYYKQ